MFSLSELHLLRTSSTLLTSNFATIYSALDAFIHMYAPTYSLLRIHTKQLHSDADDLHYVYEWRQEQERSLRIAKGSGMSEEQVNQFVDGCTSLHLPCICSSYSY